MNIDDGALSVEMTGSRFYPNPNWHLQESDIVSRQKITQFQYLNDGTLVVLLSNGIVYERANGSSLWDRQDWIKDIATSLREHGAL